MKRLNHYFQTSKPFRNQLSDCREIATQNWHVYAICCRPEGECDVVSGQNEKTIDGYVAVDFEVASSSSFRDTLKIMFHVSLKNWVRDAGSSQVAKRLISYYVGGFMKYKVFNRLWKTETDMSELWLVGWLVNSQQLVSNESNLEVDPVVDRESVNIYDMFSSRKSRTMETSFSLKVLESL